MANIFRSREVSSLAIAALLDKPDRNEIAVDAKYIGFTIPNQFVVGYGLDVGEMYRNLPFIAVPQAPENLFKIDGASVSLQYLPFSMFVLLQPGTHTG